MGSNVTRKLIEEHLVDGEMTPGTEVAIRIDQTLTQDATGTLVMLAFEAMGRDRVRTELSVQYVDHNLIQEDNRNADDHLFLRSACRRFGLWYSRPGNGVSHPVHMQVFGAPGKTLAGSDSHTCAAGALGMLAIGAGGLDVAMAMAGEPMVIPMPRVWGVHLSGSLPEWVSAKDVVLEMLRRHGTAGARGCVIEYSGPGLTSLGAMDRHVIANMGAELGATTSIFPSDGEVRRYLESEGRGQDWISLEADAGAGYDFEDEIDLSSLEPLIARPSSPGDVVPVRAVAGTPIYQAYLGSSANPGYRDFAVPAEMVRGRRVPSFVSLDVNPTSRGLLGVLIEDGRLAPLLQAGARLHQAGCNGCIGMGQAPATGRNSLRTVPRNFPGRSGTPEDSVYLCSPETATASALAGRIADPREMDMPYPRVAPPRRPLRSSGALVPPPAADEAAGEDLDRGPNITPLPELDPLPEEMTLPLLLKAGDDLSTDEILPAGARVLPWRSNIPRIARFAFEALDKGYHDKATGTRDDGGHAVIGGHNYGQGSSREHAALAPRYLGLRCVVAKSFARIHRQNLINFGVLPLVFAEEADYDRLAPGGSLRLASVRQSIANGAETVEAEIEGSDGALQLSLRCPDLSSRNRDILLAGGLINAMREARPG